MSKNHQLGLWGEDLALRFLELCGYSCLEQRYRRQCGELDLIVQRDNFIVFVEVKTRGPRSLAPAESWVSRQKLSRMKQTARYWLSECRPEGAFHFRFDVIAVEFNGENEGAELRHFTAVA